MIVNIVSARRVHQSDWKLSGVPFYRAREIVKLANSELITDQLFISENLFEKLKESGIPQPGDLMVTGVGTIGTSYVVKENDRFYYKDASVLCFENRFGVEASYLHLLLQSPFMIGQITEASAGTTVATITMKNASDFLIPLPPRPEQKRIVSQYEILYPHLRDYDALETAREKLDAELPDRLRKSILQMAVQGKLVPQDPNDEPAAVLLERIRDQRRRLIAEGEIKAPRGGESIIYRGSDGGYYEKRIDAKGCESDPVCIDDEIPFEIPEIWEWARLESIVYQRKQTKPVGIFSYVDIGSIDNNRQKLNSEETILGSAKAPSRARKPISKGDILYSTVRPYLHNACIVDKEFSAEPIASTGFAAMVCLDGVYNKFLFRYLLSPAFDEYVNANENSKGVAYPAINDKRLYAALVPIPPVNEQTRIIDLLEDSLLVVD